MLTEHFENMRSRYQELLTASAQPDTLKDIDLYQKIVVEMKELEKAAAVWEEYKKTQEALYRQRSFLPTLL